MLSAIRGAWGGRYRFPFSFGINDVRFFVPILLAVAVAGCGPRGAGQSAPGDEVLQNKIVGSWSFANGHGVLKVRPDGTFSTQATNPSKKFSYVGTWRITNGDLLLCLTESSEPQFQPVGQTNRLKILELTTNALVNFDPLLAQRNTLHRNYDTEPPRRHEPAAD